MANIVSTPSAEEAAIAEQLAQAAALRKHGMQGNTGAGMAGNVYVVGNPWGNIASSLAGAYLGNQAQERRAGLEQARNQERDAFMAQMPQSVETVPQAGPAMDGGSLPDVERQMSPRALARATQQWAARAPRGMEGVQDFALRQALLAPEKQAEQEFRAQEARALAAEKAAQAKELQAERLQAAAERAQEANALRMTLAQMSKSQGAANADLDRELKQLRIEQMKAGPAGKPPTEAERASAGYLGRMEAAERNLGTAAPLDLARQKGLEVAPSITNYFMNPKEQVSRQQQEDWVRAKLRKESGATINADEMAREIRTYFPQAGDSSEVIKQKTQSRAQALEQLRTSAGRAESTIAPSAGGVKGYDPDKEARYQAWKKAQGM